MHPYDIIMIVVLVGATAFGFWKGVAWQIASLASMVVSYFAALRFRDDVAQHIDAEKPWNCFLAMLIIFLAVSLMIWILSRYVAGVIDRVKLKDFDKQIGGLFGAAQGVLLCVVVTFFAVTLSLWARERVLESQSGHYIALLLDRAHPVMPEEIHDVLHPYLHELQDKLEHDDEHDGSGIKNPYVVDPPDVILDSPSSMIPRVNPLDDAANGDAPTGSDSDSDTARQP